MPTLSSHVNGRSMTQNCQHLSDFGNQRLDQVFNAHLPGLIFPDFIVGVLWQVAQAFEQRLNPINVLCFL